MGIFNTIKEKKQQQKEEEEKKKRYEQMNATREQEIKDRIQASKSNNQKAFSNDTTMNSYYNFLNNAQTMPGATHANNVAMEEAKKIQEQINQQTSAERNINNRFGELRIEALAIALNKRDLKMHERLFISNNIEKRDIAIPFFIEYKGNNLLDENGINALNNAIQELGDERITKLENILEFYEVLRISNAKIKEQFPTKESMYQVFPNTLDYIESLKNSFGR